MQRSLSREDIPVRHHAEEKGFKLSLPMIVEGPDTVGSYFREETILSRMSYVGALFPLSSPVSPGSRLKLAVTLPPKLSQGRELKLIIKGTITLIEPLSGRENRSQVSLKLENRYIIRGSESA